jgi:hypothetical protein
LLQARLANRYDQQVICRNVNFSVMFNGNCCRMNEETIATSKHMLILLNEIRRFDDLGRHFRALLCSFIEHTIARSDYLSMSVSGYFRKNSERCIQTVPLLRLNFVASRFRCFLTQRTYIQDWMSLNTHSPFAFIQNASPDTDHAEGSSTDNNDEERLALMSEYKYFLES